MSPKLRQIPVVVLTSSNADRGVAECYRLGASCCLTQPVDWRSFQAVIRSVVSFWFTTLTLPRSDKC